jgi:hypothetical protein
MREIVLFCRRAWLIAFAPMLPILFVLRWIAVKDWLTSIAFANDIQPSSSMWFPRVNLIVTKKEFVINTLSYLGDRLLTMCCFPGVLQKQQLLLCLRLNNLKYTLAYLSEKIKLPCKLIVVKTLFCFSASAIDLTPSGPILLPRKRIT